MNEISKAASQMRKKFLDSITPEERKARAKVAWEASVKSRKAKKISTPSTGQVNVD